MNKVSFSLLLLFFTTVFIGYSQNSLNCDFTVATKACTGQEIKITYTGGSSPNATYLWNFDGAVILSGTGQGPYYVKWETSGEKHLSLTINLENQTCTANRVTVVVDQPLIFHMTGGGTISSGGSGVEVGLSGSQQGIIYKLRLNGQYTGQAVAGTGQAISFGLQTIAGHYTSVAKVDGSDCLREMEGTAIVTINAPTAVQTICMVTYDTTLHQNKLVWSKQAGQHIAKYNIYKETYQNNIFSKIGEVPFNSLSVFPDPDSDPRVKSEKYKISATDSSGNEGEKSPFHKTIHLNINPGTTGFNLIWNHYEGFDYQTCRIFRKYNESGWVVIDSLASNVDSYTDLYSTTGITDYYLEVVRPEPCTPSLKAPAAEKVISNIVSAAPLGVPQNSNDGFLIYPNPASEKLHIVFPDMRFYQVEMFSLNGLTITKLSAQGPAFSQDVKDLPKGIYLVRIAGGESVSVGKVVIN